jgi:predicted cupin superfamily sugar epimerase
MRESLLIKDLLKKYSLEPHPEGGFARLLYEDPWKLSPDSLPSEFKSSRSLWNGIYFLLPGGCKSVFHRITMNELWNFYLGGPLELFQISPEGELKSLILGHDLLSGQEVAYVFPKNHWIAAKPTKNTVFSFVSCITAPGFTFDDWEKGDRNTLLSKYPHLSKEIISLTD